MITRHFQIRTCTLEIDGNLPRPCLYYDLHACLGPCVAGLTTKEAYDAAVADVVLFLEGRNQELAGEPRAQDAGRVRGARTSRWRRPTATPCGPCATSRSARWSSRMKGENVDVFGFFESGQDVAVVVLVVRGGVAPGPARLLLREGAGARRRALPGGVPAPVLRRQPVPARRDPPAGGHRRARAPRGVPGGAARREGRGQGPPARRGRGARAPGRAQRAASATASASGAPAATRPWRSSACRGRSGSRSRRTASRRFDISHLQGTDSVASMVVFEDGKPKKSDYRLFNIASQELLAPDDFKSMAEVVERRYRRVQEERRPVAGPRPRGRRPRAAAGGADRARPPRRRAPDRGPRQARGGDLGAGPARADPPLAQGPGAAVDPARAGRGAPLRDHAAPPAAREADAADRADRDPGRRARARAAPAAPVRLGRGAARRGPAGDRGGGGPGDRARRGRVPRRTGGASA